MSTKKGKKEEIKMEKNIMTDEEKREHFESCGVTTKDALLDVMDQAWEQIENPINKCGFGNQDYIIGLKKEYLKFLDDVNNLQLDDLSDSRELLEYGFELTNKHLRIVINSIGNLYINDDMSVTLSSVDHYETILERSLEERYIAVI